MSAIKTEHKKQLHEQIDERSKHLHATLVALQSKDSSRTSGRVTDIESALAALSMHVANGWDTIGDPQAAALVRWLDASKYLFDATLPIGVVETPVVAQPVVTAPKQTEPTSAVSPTTILDRPSN